MKSKIPVASKLENPSYQAPATPFVYVFVVVNVANSSLRLNGLSPHVTSPYMLV